MGSDAWDGGRQTKKWIRFQTAFDFSQANLKCQAKLSRVGEYPEPDTTHASQCGHCLNTDASWKKGAPVKAKQLFVTGKVRLLHLETFK